MLNRYLDISTEAKEALEQGPASGRAKPGLLREKP